MLSLPFAIACAEPDDGELRRAPPGRAEESTDVADTGTTDPTSGPCADGMALVGASLCIDRWEASIEDHSPYEVPTGGVATTGEGDVPQGYISGEVAELACANAGKRLCSTTEWMSACEGEEGRTWPYGDRYDADACNDSCGEHPINAFWGDDPDRWDSEHMNDPGINQQADTVDPAGANPGCVTPEGVWDLHGNLHEWVSDADGTFKGGFYADASINGDGCGYTTTAHSFGYHDYSTGFRCCADAR